MTMRHDLPCFLLSVGIAALLLAGQGASAQEIAVPNGSFEQATGGQPDQWTISGGTGGVVEGDAVDGGRCLRIDAAPDDTYYWRSEALPLEASTVYALRYWGKRLGEVGQGTTIAGPIFCNVDRGNMYEDWEEFVNIFMTPAAVDPDEAWIRLGHWHQTIPVCSTMFASTRSNLCTNRWTISSWATANR